jgi:hypothetical protein
VCWVNGCFSSDILKAMEVTVTDGVDVLSLSLGSGTTEYYRNSIAVAAHVMLVARQRQELHWRVPVQRQAIAQHEEGAFYVGNASNWNNSMG